MLTSYSNSVRCANLHCTGCHDQSFYSSSDEDHLLALVYNDLVKII